MLQPFLQKNDVKKKKQIRGFVLPFTLVISIIILTISAGISIILAKQLYFSKLSRLSKVAYYAADNGLMCALMVDDHYVDSSTGIGIFEYDPLLAQETSPQAVMEKVNAERSARGYSPVAIDEIKCATSEIFKSAVSGYATSPFARVTESGTSESGRATSFNMRMDLGDGTERCATIVVNKTPTYRQIVSRGFASCGSVGTIPIERAIVHTSDNIGAGSGSAPSSQTPYQLTSGTSWVIPQGVTRLQIWAIGAGGGGAGATNIDDTSAGGGGAGGIAHQTNVAVTPGDTLVYSIGSPGAGGIGAAHGNDGGDTEATIAGLNIRGKGGGGGRFNSGVRGTGGAATGGVPNRSGGDGAGASGDIGGGGGGGLGTVDGTIDGCNGGTGGTAADVAGYMAVAAMFNYPTSGAGTGAGCGNTNPDYMNGTAANGFGSGGGGAGHYGGNGGNGYIGGGGGGAAGYTSGVRGGNGGSGIILIYTQ